MSDGETPLEAGSGLERHLEKTKKFLLHPVTVVMVLGLAIRLIIMPILTHNYDVTYWALIIRNIQTGNGLYEITGYYYTPVWGYILAVVGKLCAIFGVDTGAVRFDDLLFVEDAWWRFYVADLTNISFNVLVKIPLAICDMVVGYLIYWLVKDRTGDKKKATLGLALWMLCPITIFLSAAHGMFDTISVLFTVLTVIMVYKGKYFRAGITFSAAVFTKFFPIYLVFILLAYIFRKHSGDRPAQIRALERAALGFVAMSLLLYAPMIMQNTVMDSFLFFTNRVVDAAASGGGSDTMTSIVNLSKSAVFIIQPIILAFVCYVSYRFLKYRDGNVEEDFLKACMFSLAIAFSMPMSPQYLVILLPFLIYYVVAVDRSYLKPFLAVGIGAALVNLFMCNIMLLLSFAKYTGFIGIGTLANILLWMEAPFVFGMSRMLILILLGGAVQMMGIWLIVYKGAKGIIEGEVNEG